MKSIKFLRTSALVMLSLMASATQAQTHFDFDLTKQQPRYSDAQGYGWDFQTTAPGNTAKYFSVKVPDGNYRVTFIVGSKKTKAETQLRTEARRLLLEPTVTKKNELLILTYTINKHSPVINERERVNLKPSEGGNQNWDDRLTFEINGSAPAVQRIIIDEDHAATTVWLCGNSTVVDQSCEPWASWGQMFTTWFDAEVCIANLAQSGLTASTFLGQHRLDYILSKMKKGDYVFVEFGHNDQKEKSAGSGAWYNFSYNLKRFVDEVRGKGGHIVFVTPTQRRRFDNGRILESHGDYPDAMRAVAKRENAPLVELHDMTRTFFETLGEENSKRSLVHYPAGTFPGQDKAFADNTHFNTYGAYEISKMVVMGLKMIGSPLVKHLRANWRDYAPSTPGDFNTWHLYPSCFYDNQKPEGN